MIVPCFVTMPRSLRMAFHRLQDLLSEFVLLKQMAEGQDCCLIGDSVANQVNSRKAEHRWCLVQSLFHAWIAAAVPLLHQVNSYHCRQWIGRTASFLACFWIARLDQLQKGLPLNYLLHFGHELLAFSPFLGRGLLVIGETQLLAPHSPVLASDHTDILARSGLVFQGLPS